MTKQIVVQPTVGHNIGINVGNAISAESDIVTGYLAARDPEVIEARKAKNIAVRSALTAQLLADLAK